MFAVERRLTAAPPPPVHDRSRREGSSGGPVPPPPGWTALATRLPVAAADPPARNPAPAPPAPSPSAAPAPSAQAPAPPPPELVDGKIVVEDRGHSKAPAAEALPATTRHDVTSDFTVKAEAFVREPGDGDWAYGLVQNVMFSHFEAKFEKGDMLVDVVGPNLDIWPGERAPFMHDGEGNPVVPTFLGSRARVTPHFTDRPFWPLTGREQFCGQTVRLLSAERSILFRAGLVARSLGTGRLVQLGAVEKAYLLAWRLSDVDVRAGTSKLESLNKLAGDYPLAKPGIALALAPPTAVTEINKARNEELADMEQRCENLL